MEAWFYKINGVLYPASNEDKEQVDKVYTGTQKWKHVRVRNPKLHRKYFAFIGLVWKNLPEKYEKHWPTRKTFRKEMEMWAGHYEMTINLKGERAMQPKSIEYGELDDIEFSELFIGVKNVIGKHILPDIETFVKEIEQFYG